LPKQRIALLEKDQPMTNAEISQRQFKNNMPSGTVNIA